MEVIDDLDLHNFLGNGNKSLVVVGGLAERVKCG